MSKAEVLAGNVSGGKLPNFVSWNWTMIRGALFWGVLSGLLACLATVVALVAMLPRTCDPQLPWYQGGVFYEIFPASFQDSNGDGVGDLRGLASRVEYLTSLNIRAVRLNSIFQAEHFPDRYKNVTSLLNIAAPLGNMQDMAYLINSLHNKNISLILDLPIYPYVTRLDDIVSEEDITNSTETAQQTRLRNITKSVVRVVKDDHIATAIRYWSSNGVDGFYLKGAEYFVDDSNFSDHIKLWKKIIGQEKVIIVSYEALQKAHGIAYNTLMNKADLVDVFLEVTNGTAHVKSQVEGFLKGALWSKPGAPWAHWSVGNVDSRRLSSSLTPNQTIAVLLLNIMLPGTPNIFYGDEVGLREISEPEEDYHESKHIHNLVPMAWPEGSRQFSSRGVLPWALGGGGGGAAVALRDLIALRPQAPPVYLNAVWKDGAGLPNAQLRRSGSILVVERWYPRRNTFLLLVNLEDKGVRRDLSSWYYGGVPLVATDSALQGQQLVFKELSLRPAEAMVVKLEK